MTAHQEAGKAPSQSLNVHVRTTSGHWKLRPWLHVQLPLEMVLQLLPSSGVAPQASLSPHSMPFPEYLLKEAARRHLRALARGEQQTEALLSSYVL